MSAPQNIVNQNGISQVSADALNTYVQWCTSVAQLRSFIGVSNMLCQIEGFSSPLDGGQGLFYWNSAGVAADDGGLTTVVPNGAASGEWTRIQNPTVETYSYQVPLTGFSITIPSYTNALILNPAGTLSTGTIIMPAALFDGQRVEVTSSQIVTTLTITANAGQTVYGAPSTISPTTPFAFIYKLSTKSFYRIV